VHQLYDEQGPEAAHVLGLKLGLKPGTLSSWFGFWRRQAKPTKNGEKAKPVAKKNGETKPAEQMAHA
jgi:hypothetical protein